MEKYLLLAIFFLLTACTSGPAGNSGACLDSAAADKTLPAINETLSGMYPPGSVSKESRLTLLENKCDKRVYKRDQFRVILFKNPGDPPDHFEATLLETHPVEMTAGECMERARVDIGAAHLDFGFKLLALDQERYPWLANDPDVGPSKWLRCTKKKDAAYYTSLATMLHEVNHGLKTETCLLSADEQTPLCFDLPTDPVPQSIALLSKIPADRVEMIAGMDYAQKLYLVTLKQPLLLFFDELNSYIITERTQTRILQTFGRPAVEHGDKTRDAELLPLFQLLVARYFTELKRTNYPAYNEIMKKPLNVASLRSLLASGERAREERLVEMRRQKLNYYDVELNLWDEYVKLRPGIFPAVH